MGVSRIKETIKVKILINYYGVRYSKRRPSNRQGHK